MECSALVEEEEELLDYFTDTYKELFGFRPTWA
jgi:hypothetical protein